MYTLTTPKTLAITFLLIITLQSCSAQEPTMLKRIRECFSKFWPINCLKEEALDALNHTIMSETPMTVFGLIDIAKNPSYKPNLTEIVLPDDHNERGAKLNSLLYSKVEEYFESRIVKFSLANVVEGRKKKGKGGGAGGMLMMGGLAMAGMMGQMFMGKVAFLAGAALLVSKMALMLAAISALKKGGGGGGGGGESQHIVYTTSSDSGYGHSHGGGGWHRSLSSPEAHSVVYGGQMPSDNISF